MRLLFLAATAVVGKFILTQRLSGILLAAVAMQFVFDGLAASGLLAAGK